MYGGSVFVPKPMMWAGAPAPDPEYNSAFYNPSRTEEGQEKLESFLSAYFSISGFVPEEERSEIMAKIEEFNIPQDQDLSILNGSQINYREVLSDASLSPVTLFEYLMEALENKHKMEVAQADLGESLENWDIHLGESGVYDAQLLFPLFKASNGVSFSIPEENRDKLNDHIDNLSSAQLEACCSRLGISVEDHDQARETLKDALNRISELPQFNSEALEGREDSTQRKSMTPAIGMVGVNIIGRAMHNTQEAKYKEAVKRAQQMERETKKAEKKHAAKQAKLRKEAMAKARSKKNESQRRGKV